MTKYRLFKAKPIMAIKKYCNAKSKLTM